VHIETAELDFNLIVRLYILKARFIFCLEKNRDRNAIDNYYISGGLFGSVTA
jgi:hypothetical protein